MKMLRRGFTLIEVSLFLAVTALLFVGIIAGTQNSISQQRYNDAVNGFVDFIKNVYSEVSNPQSTGNGNSDQAIYGRLIVFGESKDLNGATNEGQRGIFVYDVLGKANAADPSGALEGQLGENGIGATVFREEKVQQGSSGSTFTHSLYFAGNLETYYPRWQSKIEAINKGSTASTSILIIRHPRSGTINTLVGDRVELNNYINSSDPGAAIVSAAFLKNGNCASGTDFCNNYKTKKYLVASGNSFSGGSDIDLCISVFGDSNNRRNVRIVKNARNATGVQLIDADSNDNRCK